MIVTWPWKNNSIKLGTLLTFGKGFFLSCHPNCELRSGATIVCNVTDNQDIVISWYNISGIERQRRRDKSALENLGEQWIFLVKFILDLDLPLDTDSKPKVRICMTNGWQLAWLGSFLGYGAQIKRVKAFGWPFSLVINKDDLNSRWPKKYCLIQRKIHNSKVKEIFKSEICLDYQWANLNFDILILPFDCYLAEIWMFKHTKAFWKLSKMRKK